MGKLELKIFLYLFAVVNRDALTQPQRHRGTEDDGSLKGGGERRGLSSSANSAALRLILELGKNEAVIGGLRE